MSEFRVVAISHKTASLQIREQLVLNKTQIDILLIHLKEVFSLDELFILSTCNRTEIYYLAENDYDFDILKVFLASMGFDISLSRNFTRLAGDVAIRHLFEVATGLDSMVLGERQILNQVKQAYQQCIDNECAGPFIHRLLHTVFYANKKISHKTRLQDGTASVASVAVDIVSSFIANISKPHIALIGLGEIGQNVLENLGDIDAAITLVNRTKLRAEKLANQSHIKVVEFSQLSQIVLESDLIICATGSTPNLINKSDIEQSPTRKLILDLSIPRAVNADVEKVSGVILYNNDQISDRIEVAKEIRLKAVPEANHIITEVIVGFKEWRDEIEISPTIKKLKNALEKIRREEIARTSVGEEQMELLETVTKNMIQKVIKLPVLKLKSACKRGDSERLVDAINDIFNLEEVNIKKV